MPRLSYRVLSGDPWNPRAEMIILEVEARPYLYAPNSPGYGNIPLKNEAWVEVAQNLSDDWDVLTGEEKYKRSRDLQAKWKHFRDNFRRECLARRGGALLTTSGLRPRRPYRYFNQMRFLAPYIRDDVGKKTKNSPPREELVEEETMECSISVKTEPVDEEYLQETSSPSPGPFTPPDLGRAEDSPHPCSTVTERDSTRLMPVSSECDEDRAFCMSLVPSLQRMHDENKISAKIEILGVLKKYLFRRQTGGE